MPTLKAKLFNFVMRNRHLMQGKLRKAKFDANTSIADFREQAEKGAERYAKIPLGLRIEALDVAGMQAEWLIPDGANPKKAILYVHGGGYVSGSCNDHRAFVSKFASFCGVQALQYEYRLAPEHPFPAAVDDSIRAYEWLLGQGFAPDNLLLAGESAGGGLVLALLLALKGKGMGMPAGAVAISPWTDLTCSSDSYTSKNRVSVAPQDSWLVFSRHYVGDQPANLPLISPLFGDLHGLPPLFINSGTDDELFDDGEKFFRKAKAAGVDVTFRAGDGMVHCYPLLAPMFPEATQAMQEICDFINYRLAPPRSSSTPKEYR